jgi:hypothetical protein
MQGNGNGRSVGRTLASIPFHKMPGIGWRLHMSKIAAKYLPVASTKSARWR